MLEHMNRNIFLTHFVL